MYYRIGNKIKGLAVAQFMIGIVLSLIAGVMIGGIVDWIIALLGCLGGIVLSWISSWMLYGFGELISKVTDIENTIRKINPDIVAVGTSTDYHTM